ncbi:glycosyl transferase, group 1, partial [Loktanella sp. DJP18]
MKKRLLFVQFGDFREAFERFAGGGPETYRDQEKSVGYVSGLARENLVTTLCFGTDSYDSEIAPNLHARGVVRGAFDQNSVQDVMDELQPSHLVLRTPHIGFLSEAAKRNCHVLPTFADIMQRNGLRQAWRNRNLRHKISRIRAPCVSNHSLNASKSLVTVLGLSPSPVIPWDWSKVPIAGPLKPAPDNTAGPQIFFAGNLSEAKGVGDCIAAIAILHQQGH